MDELIVGNYGLPLQSRMVTASLAISCLSIHVHLLMRVVIVWVTILEGAHSACMHILQLVYANMYMYM